MIKISIKNILKKTDKLHYQLIRYTFVGGFAFFIDFATLTTLTEFFNINYLISAAIAFTLGLIVNYVLSIFWVFNRRKYQNKYIEVLLFTIIGIIGLGFNEMFIWIFTEKFAVHYLISKILTTGIVYLWNFFARKYLLFSNKTANK